MASGTATRRAPLRAVLARCASPVLTSRQAAAAGPRFLPSRAGGRSGGEGGRVMVDEAISLEDKFTRSAGRVFLTGLQALVRLPMAQIRRDRRRGLKTAGFISGYRGSPLGGYDQQLEKAQAASRRPRHRLPAGRQRGPRRVRGLGQPAAPALARRALRRRGRHLVRQGAGRRPLGRRAQARQRRGLVPAWRRAVPRRRRPRRQVVVDPAPVGPRLHVGADADALPVLDPRVHRAWGCSASRCRATRAAGSA